MSDPTPGDASLAKPDRPERSPDPPEACPSHDFEAHAVRDIRVQFGFGPERAIALAFLAMSLALVWVFSVVMMRTVWMSTNTVAMIAGITGSSSTLIFVVFQIVANPAWAARRKLERLLARDPRPATVDAVIHALQIATRSYGIDGCGPSNNGMLAAAGKLLAQYATSNSPRVFLIGPDVSRFPPLLPPFEVTFEPTPINQNRASFAELRGEPVTNRDLAGAALRDLVALPYASKRRRWLNYAVILVVVGFLGTMLIAKLVNLLTAQSLQDWIGPLIFLGILAAVIIWQHLRGDSWFAVPAGVIVLESKQFSSRVTARLFTRSDSVLLWVAPAGSVAVASQSGHVACARISPFEGQLLLRAWLSRVPSPDARIVDAFAATMV